MSLFKDLKKCKKSRKKYRIKPCIRFYVDKEDYYFSFLPTILWMPWIYRRHPADGVIDIWWLHFHILIGRWEYLSCSQCVHRDDCVKAGKLQWHSDDIFEREKKCSDFKTLRTKF